MEVWWLCLGEGKALKKLSDLLYGGRRHVIWAKFSFVFASPSVRPAPICLSRSPNLLLSDVIPAPCLSWLHCSVSAALAGEFHEAGSVLSSLSQCVPQVEEG